MASQPLTPKELRALQPQGVPPAKPGLSEEEKAVNRGREGPALDNLLTLADEVRGEPYEFAFPRKSGFVRFRVHAVTEREAYDANKKATTYKEQKALGIRVAQENDPPLFRAYLILLATVPEDRQALWQNQQLLDKFGVNHAALAVELMLRAGEKDQVVDKINELSGFGQAAQESRAEVLDDVKN